MEDKISNNLNVFIKRHLPDPNVDFSPYLIVDFDEACDVIYDETWMEDWMEQKLIDQETDPIVLFKILLQSREDWCRRFVRKIQEEDISNYTGIDNNICIFAYAEMFDGFMDSQYQAIREEMLQYTPDLLKEKPPYRVYKALVDYCVYLWKQDVDAEDVSPKEIEVLTSDDIIRVIIEKYYDDFCTGKRAILSTVGEYLTNLYLQRNVKKMHKHCVNVIADLKDMD